MYVVHNHDLQTFLQRRGVPVHAAIRATYLNRNVGHKEAKTIAEDTSLTYSQQAAKVLQSAFDWTDTREGREYWADLFLKLNAP